MIENSGPSLLRLTQIFELQAHFSRKGLSLAAAQAIVFIAIASSDEDSPMLPNGSDIARAIGKSQSGTSRLLANLLDEEQPYIASDRDLNDGKSELFFLTEWGHDLVESVMRAIDGSSREIRIRPLDLREYGHLKFSEKRGIFGLKVLRYHTSGHGLDLALPEEDIFAALCKWTEDNDAPSSIEKLQHFVRIVFSSRSLSIRFMCRWGIPIR